MPLADECVQCVVTSPPYWGLRKYAGEQELIWGPSDCIHEWTAAAIDKSHRDFQKGNPGKRWNHDPSSGGETAKHVPIALGNNCARCGAWKGQFGLEPTIQMYVAHTVEILREIRRVLRKDGVCFWNIGDSYHGGNKGNSGTIRPGDKQATNKGSWDTRRRGGGCLSPSRSGSETSLKCKDLCLIPSRVALAAQDDDWWVRSMIVWAKPNPMPESVKDRPTDAYEYILMLTKSQRYFWDAKAVQEQAVAGWNSSSFTDPRDQAIYENLGRGPRNEFGYAPKGRHAKGNGDGGPKSRARAEDGTHKDWTASTRAILETRNMRNVWMFATQPYKDAHFATFPEELPRRCITAASRHGDLILDPFAGSGTTGRVAIELGRRALLLDIAYTKGAYKELAERRTSEVQIDLLR